MHLVAVTSTLDLSPILDVLIQIAALVLMGLASWAAGAAARSLHITAQNSLLQRVLDAVDRGISYGQQVATADAVKAGKVAVPLSAVQASAVNYVVDRLPGTLNSLGMTPQHVADLVLAKLPAQPAAGA